MITCDIYLCILYYLYMQKLNLDLLIKTKQNQAVRKHTGFGPNTYLQSWFLCSDISSADVFTLQNVN